MSAVYHMCTTRVARISEMCLLFLCAVSAGIDQCGDGDYHRRYSVAHSHHADRLEADVEDQDHHPEELNAFQTHPAEGRQVEIMQQPCHHSTAGLT